MIDTGCDVFLNVLTPESNRSAAVANSTDWNFSRFNQLINQAARNVEPFGDVANGQQAFQFFTSFRHVLNLALKQASFDLIPINGPRGSRLFFPAIHFEVWPGTDAFNQLAECERLFAVASSWIH